MTVGVVQILPTHTSRPCIVVARWVRLMEVKSWTFYPKCHRGRTTPPTLLLYLDLPHSQILSRVLGPSVTIVIGIIIMTTPNLSFISVPTETPVDSVFHL